MERPRGNSAPRSSPVSAHLSRTRGLIEGRSRPGIFRRQGVWRPEHFDRHRSRRSGSLLGPGRLGGRGTDQALAQDGIPSTARTRSSKHLGRTFVSWQPDGPGLGRPLRCSRPLCFCRIHRNAWSLRQRNVKTGRSCSPVAAMARAHVCATRTCRSRATCQRSLFRDPSAGTAGGTAVQPDPKHRALLRERCRR